MSAAGDQRSLKSTQRAASTFLDDVRRFDVFISCARADADAAERLRAALGERGHAAWLRVVNATAEADEQARGRRAIEACTAFVFLISPDAVGSSRCVREVEQAAGLSKLIVPVLVRGVERERLPVELASREWVSIGEVDDFDAGVDRLVEALSTDLDWRDQHTRLAARTREWLDAARDRSFLLRGSDLRDAERWLGEQGDHLQTPTAEHGEYIAASRRATTARQRALLGGVLGTLLVSMALAIVAFVQRDRAVHDRMVAVSRSVSAQAVVIADSDPALAAALSLEAYRIRPTAEARDTLRSVLSRLGPSIGALKGHTERVNSVAVSPDGKTVAGAGQDKTVRLWDLATRAEIGRPLTGHRRAVTGVAFSPDGKLLVSVSDDKTVRLWDVAARRPSGRPLSDQAGEIFAVAFSPDGKTLASAGADRTVRLWDVATRRAAGPPLTGHDKRVTSVAFSPDGRTLASGSLDATARLWDVATRGAIGAPLPVHGGGIMAVAFDPTGSSLATANRDETLRLWDVKRRRPARPPIGGRHGNVARWLWAVAFSPDGRTVASAGLDGTVRLWRVASGRAIGPPLAGRTFSGAFGLAFTPDGSSLASADGDHTVRLWNVAADATHASPVTRLPRRPLGGALTPNATAHAFSPDRRTRASGCSDNRVRLWNVDTNAPIGPPLTGHSGEVHGVAFSPDGKVLASAGHDETVRLWSLKTHRQLGAPLVGHTKVIRGLAFSPDSETLVSASDDKTVRLWDVATHRQLGPPLKGDAVLNVAFSPDGATLATAGANPRLWNIATRRPLEPPLTGHTDLVHGLAFSPDGTTLATTSFDGTARLWSVATRSPVSGPLRGHSGGVWNVAFSPDGKTLASVGGDDQTTRVWDVASGTALGAPVPGGPGAALGVAFSPDGTSLTSSFIDDSAISLNSILWSRSLQAQRARLCAAARRNLSRAEWSTYLPGEPYRKTCP